MSLSETRELLQILVEINTILTGITVKTTDLKNKTPMISKNLGSFRQLERVALRYLALAQRFGLPDDVDKAASAVARLIVLLNMAQMSMNMLMKGTAVGWAMGIASFGMTALSAGNMMEGY
jgi:hypothetical protein